MALPGGSLTALVDAAVQMPAGGVVYGASFENHPALVARLAERHALLGNAPQTLRARARPAAARRRRCATRASPYPRTLRRGARRSLAAAGCASRCAAAAARACARGAAARCRPATVVQERIDGRRRARRRRSATGVDAVVLGVTEQLVGRPRVRRARLPLVRERRRRRACPPASATALLGAGARDLLAPGRRVRACAGCSASTSSGTASARGRSRSTRARRRRSRRSRRRTASACSARTCGRAPASCRGVERRAARGAAGKAVALRHRGRGHRRQRALAGARRARRPAPRRAHRRGPSDLHVVATAATPRGTRSPALEEQAARLRAELEPRVEVAAGG